MQRGESGGRQAQVSTTRRRARWAALAAVVVFGVAPVDAQTAEIDSARAQRDELRQAAAAAAGELDPLLTEDAELEAAVEALDAHVAAQEARLDATRQAITAAEQDVERISQRTLEVQDEIAGVRLRLRQQAVTAYLQPGGDGLADVMLASADLNEAARKLAMLDAVAERETGLIDAMRALENEMLALERSAEDAVARIEQRRADEEVQLAELEASRAEQLRLREALALRIADVQAEIDALADAEEEITRTIQALIAEEETRRAAEAEARRRAAESARLAELSEGRVGTGGSSGSGSGSGNAVATPPAGPSGTNGSDDSGSALAPPAFSGRLSWPVAGAVTSGFGPRWGRMHQGIDINAAIGTPVGSAAPGTVIAAGSNGGYGNMVIVDHGGGLTTLYAHLTDIWVSVGQTVSTGTGLGSSGCTGSCTGPHLHFETRVWGIAYDPMGFL